MANWETSLWDQVTTKTGLGLCCTSLWCTPCVYGRAARRLDNFPDPSTPPICNTHGWIFYFSGYFYACAVPLTMKRGDMRDSFKIEGATWKDCLISCFCPCVALAQMETEVKRKAAKAKAPEMAAYSQPPNGMQYQAPPAGAPSDPPAPPPPAPGPPPAK